MPFKITLCLTLLLCVSCYNIKSRACRTTIPVTQTEEARTVIIEVKRDERLQDFVKRLEKTKLTSVQAIAEQAATLLTALFPFYPAVPPANSREPSYLEGLFPPGRYELPLAPVSATEEKAVTCQIKYNARYILTYLLRHSLTRYQGLSFTQGLTPYEQIVLASLVEKESVSNQDYELVAGVFYNRLKQQMNLSSCPSLEYALGYHRPFLTRKDIQLNSPYNLYRKKGLPPTPICFFSDEALAAVTRPVRTPYLFFVYDWVEDKLLFASNYVTHLQNVGQARTHYVNKHGKQELYRIFPQLYYEHIHSHPSQAHPSQTTE